MSPPAHIDNRTPLAHYRRASPTSSLLLENSAVPRAATVVVDELTRVLEKHRANVAEVDCCASDEPCLGAPGADAVLNDVLRRTASLLARTAPGVRLAERNPAQGPTVPGLADQVLTCVDRKLDAIEERLEKLYGIPRVIIELPTQVDSESESADLAGVPGFGGTEILPLDTAAPVHLPPHQSKSNNTSNTHLQNRLAAPTQTEGPVVTPLRPQSEFASQPAPSTPQLEDFEIDDTAIQFLKHNQRPNQPLLYHLGSTKKPRLPADAPYEDVVQRSVEALGIQTPVQVAERFRSATRGNTAVGDAESPDILLTPEVEREFVLQLDRSGIPSGGAPVEDPVPAVAAACMNRVPRPPSPPKPAPESDRRKLLFDDDDEDVARGSKPQTASALRMTRSRAKRAATEEAVNMRYSKMANYLQSKFPKATILSACDILHTLHERKSLRSSLFIPKDELPGTFASITADSEDQNMLIYALSKLEIIILRKERKTNAVCYEFGV